MSRFCFEMYQVTERGLKFKGYKTIIAESTEQALLSAQDSVDEDIKIAQIYIPNE